MLSRFKYFLYLCFKTLFNLFVRIKQARDKAAAEYQERLRKEKEERKSEGFHFLLPPGC